MTAPYEYHGDTISKTGYSMDEIAGTYEFINHGISNSGSMLPTLTVNLNKDYTVTGDVKGTWGMTDGTYYMNMVIKDVTYKGVFFKQNDESKFDSKVMTFSAVGSNNQVIWGSRSLDDSTAVQFDAYDLENKIPEKVRTNIKLPVTGDHKTTITWSSSNKRVIDNTGAVKQRKDDVEVTLTARITKGGASMSKSFKVIVTGK